MKTHKFPEIVGWHDPMASTPLRLEMLRWSQISQKAAFDDVFVKYAKSLKPGFLVAQWNHLGDFGQISGDERCLLPKELWGKDEDYLWYSTGGAANFTDLAAGVLGEGTLQARYIRGAFDDKPFTLGKYESTRTRVAIAELAANGGAPMGFYARHKDPEARKELVRYYRFLAANDAAFKANRPHAEVALLFPRSKVHQGDVASVEAFKKTGRDLLDRHVLFDVIPDDLATPDRVKLPRRGSPGPRPPPARGAQLVRRAEDGARVGERARGRRRADASLRELRPRRAEGEAKPRRRDQGREAAAVEGVKADVRLPDEGAVTAGW